MTRAGRPALGAQPFGLWGVRLTGHRNEHDRSRHLRSLGRIGILLTLLLSLVAPAAAQPDGAAGQAADRAALWDEAAPISSALRIPVLSSGLFSTFWTLPVLTSWTARLPFPQLTRYSKSSTKLSSNAAPFSSLLHLPLLK